MYIHINIKKILVMYRNPKDKEQILYSDLSK